MVFLSNSRSGKKILSEDGGVENSRGAVFLKGYKVVLMTYGAGDTSGQRVSLQLLIKYFGNLCRFILCTMLYGSPLIIHEKEITADIAVWKNGSG